MRIQSIHLLTFLLSALPVFSEEITTFGQVLGKASDAIGPVADVLGIVSFIIENLPDPEKIHGTKVTIGVNQNNVSSDGFGGTIRTIWGYDSLNHVLGSADLDQKVPAGEATQIEIHQQLGQGVPAQYISILAGDDETCISYVVATFPGESDSHSWMGDVGSICGQSWYMGYSPHGTFNGTAYYPRCTWMDTNHGDKLARPVPITNRQMKINMLAYDATNPEASKGTDYLCNASIFTWENDDPIAEAPSRGPNPLTQQQHARRAEGIGTSLARVPRPRTPETARHLIVNSRVQQSAVDLCHSPTSRGQDFASTNEGLFCDMETKTLHQLCSDSVKVDCYDLDTEQMALTRVSDPKRGIQSRDVKNYNRLSHWD
ncbi:Hypothetical protein R9X50_00463000 [Acrodontium crateriforme]|uniref:Uncharacterized protein n=1 Tax=Acrodontium crateriforme TaxID=150365 RepID=A0AAQ3M6F2_9PEZI|nr:Hypothetical protein R9X50_00463000 [Acrodontium crateriforme]